MAREKWDNIWTPEIVRDYAWLTKKCDKEYDEGKPCERIVIECVEFGLPAGIVIAALHECGILFISYGIEMVGKLKISRRIPSDS